MTTGLIIENYTFNFAFLDMSLLWNIFLFAKKALFPREILSFISSSIVLSVFTVDSRYLNDLTCSISLFSIFKGFNWSCLLEHFRYFVLCTFTFRQHFRDKFFKFTNVYHCLCCSSRHNSSDTKIYCIHKDGRPLFSLFNVIVIIINKFVIFIVIILLVWKISKGCVR